MDDLDSTLDLMVDHLLRFDEIAFSDLVQFVWRREWELEQAQAPHDELPLRRALKACLIERMVDIWNAPPKNSAEKSPVWCSDIPALEEAFSVIKPEEQYMWENEPCNAIFVSRNIYAPKEFMFFL